MQRTAAFIASVVAALIALQSLWTSGIGLFDPFIHRPIILGAAVVAGILYWPLAKELQATEGWAGLLWAVDLSLMAGTLWGCWRYIDVSERLADGLFFIDGQDILLGFVVMLTVMELTRRTVGWPIFILTGLALIYMVFGEYLPGFLGNAGYSTRQVVEDLWLSTSGVVGTPFGIMLSLVIVYIVFGSIIAASGAGDALIRISVAVTGRFRGGPAHGAVASSAMFGSISGSTIANVVGTGTFTIPLIKKQGFTGRFAGAVEAAASTGGQFTPPVMGAAAFLMADLTGIPYAQVALAATIPALVFYISLFFAVELEAKKLGVDPTPQADRVRLTRRDWLNGLMFVLPILTILALLIAGRSPANAAFWAIWVTIAMTFLMNRDLRQDPFKLVTALVDGGMNAVRILIVIACIGVFIGVINSTGLAVKLAQLIGTLSEDDLFLSLVVTALAATVLSMGVPTTPAYLIIVLTMGPALLQLNAPLLAVHMFILYYGVLGSITPPVAGASYTAAPIARADPLALSFTAVRLTIVAYIMPFIFIFSPEIMIVVGDPTLYEIASITVRAVLGVILITGGLGRREDARFPVADMILRVIVGLGCLMSQDSIHYPATLAGVALVAVPMILRRSARGLAKS